MPRDPQASFSTVHRYFTPFALVLVTAALCVSRPEGVYAAAAYGVLGFSFLFNYAAHRFAKRPGWLRMVRESRMGVNLAANSFLVFLLLPFWRPIWLLFVLTPVATGVYDNRIRTIQMAAALALLLGWAYWLTGLHSRADLAEAAVHAFFILFISLFVHQVAHETEGAATVKL